MNKTVVINAVGLHSKLIGEYMPFLQKWKAKNHFAFIEPMLPAVTCAVQATYITGVSPAEHGIVGNGWFFKETQEIRFWHQSHKLIQKESIWQQLKKENPDFTCSYMFWWYNMYSGADYSLTPRPQYLADGRKLPDCYSHPTELRDFVQSKLGTFPLFDFWGPRTSIKSTEWITKATIMVDQKYNPTLTFVYLPHLDYGLQKYGQDFSKIKTDLGELDTQLAILIKHYEEQGANVLVLSEYGITNVDKPLYLNRIFRKKGWLALRVERGTELLDAGASKVFAVCDHQIAHIYINDLTLKDQVRQVLENVEGIEKVLDKQQQQQYCLNHNRSGDFVAVADTHYWFSYYYWEKDSKAPDFARTVEIHKKPGYDPVELFTNPKIKFLTFKVIWKLILKKLGFRVLMDIIPLDADLVKGSHGRIPDSKEDWPVLISNQKFENEYFKAVDIKILIEKMLKKDFNR